VSLLGKGSREGKREETDYAQKNEMGHDAELPRGARKYDSSRFSRDIAKTSKTTGKRKKNEEVKIRGRKRWKESRQGSARRQVHTPGSATTAMRSAEKNTTQRMKEREKGKTKIEKEVTGISFLSGRGGA